MIPTISLAMIVCNEENYLAECLTGIRQTVDEIVIVDTGSTDQTREIAKQFTEKVYSFSWQNDFSAARNYAIEQSTGEWILSLDADEKLQGDSNELRSVISRRPECAAFFLPLHSQRTTTAGDFDRYAVLRLFRNLPAYRFAGKIHEQVMLEKPATVGTAPGPVIVHRMVLPRERNRKRNRNLGLLKKALRAEPENCFLQYYLGVEWLGLGQFSKALPYFLRVCSTLSDEHLLFRAPAVRHTITCLMATGRGHDVDCLCQEEIRRYPAYTDLFFDYGLLFIITGRYRDALQYFEKAVESGLPPAIFSHTNGTESFLALYHAGECHEKLGEAQAAQACYQQALSANPAFVYPLCRLFFLSLTAEGASRSFTQFRESGYLKNKQWSKLLAHLFFIAGFSRLAADCLENHDFLQEDDLLSLAHYLLYSGSGDQALAILQRLEQRGEVPLDCQIDQVIAGLVAGDYRRARQRALSLWRKPQTRSAAWALLSLISRYSNSEFYRGVEKSRETEVARVLLTIAADCLRTNPGRDGAVFRRLAAEAVGFVSGMSPAGSRLVANFWQEQVKDVQELMDILYFQARSLYV